MSTTAEELNVIIKADNTKYVKALKEAMAKLDAFGDRSKKNSKIFDDGLSRNQKSIKALSSSIFKMAGTFGGLYAIFKGGSMSIKLASDLQEAQNVVDVAFGNMAYKIEEFSKTSIEQFGLSELTSKKTAAMYMAMAVGMGVINSTASDMALELTGLTSDMASFYNVSQSVANTAVSSIFTGETESFKKLGIVLTEVNLQEYARQQGIDKSITKMTQQEKVILRYNYILEQTKLVQGDFLRTNDSWANQGRMLSENIKELGTTMGQYLIPMLSPIIALINNIIMGFNGFIKSLGTVFSMLTGKQLNNAGGLVQQGQVTNKIMQTVNSTVGSQNRLTKAIKKTNKELNNGLSGFDNLNILTTKKAESTGGSGNFMPNTVVPTVPNLSTGSGMANLEETSKGIAKLLEPIKKSFNNLNSALKPFSDKIGDGLSWFLDNVLIPMGTIVTTMVVPIFLDILSGAIKLLTEVIEALSPLGEWLFNTFLKPLMGITTFVIIGALEILKTALSGLSDWVSNNQEVFRVTAIVVAGFFASFKIGTLGGISGIVTKLSTSIGGKLKGSIVNATDTVRLMGMYSKDTFDDLIKISKKTASGVKKLGDRLRGVGDAMSKKFTNAIDTGMLKLKPFGDSIKANTGKVIGFTKNMALKGKAVIDSASKIAISTGITIASTTATTLATVATWAFNTAIAVLTSPITLVVAAIGALIGVVYLLIKNWDTVKAVAKACWDGIVNVFSNAFNWFDDFVVQPIIDAYSRLFDNIKNIFDNIIGFIKNVFTGNWDSAWENVKNIFGSVFDSLITIVKTPINIIINIINGLIGGIASGINAVIGAVNKINFKVPDWVPVFGGNSIGFNLQRFVPWQIPHLASGSVAEPNKKFLAVLGDNTREHEVISPLSTIRKAVREVVNESNINSDNRDTPKTFNIYATFELGGKSIGRQLIKIIDEERNRVGAILT